MRRRGGLWPVAAGFLVLSVGTSGLQSHAAASSPPPPQSAAGERFVVRFGDIESQRRAEVAAEAGYELLDELPGSAFALVSAVRADAGPDGVDILDVSPVQRVEAAGDAGDPMAELQWHLPMIRASQARQVADGTGSVVAVIDSGVADPDASGRSAAPDLAGTAFVPGKDYVEDDAVPQDENGHGTHVTSTIAATTGNGIGVAGVAPGVTIMPLRVLDEHGLGWDWHVAEAILWAADHGAQVINLSVASSADPDAEAPWVLERAVEDVIRRGVTVVAASGNDGVAKTSWPAALPGVIAVGAVRLDGVRAPYSNHGSGLTLVAPGGDPVLDQDGDGHADGILQEGLLPWDSDTYCWCYETGTSMAAPQVSAVAAMLVDLGVSRPDEVRRILQASAWDLGRVGRDDQYGHGLLDARAAVLHAIGQPPPAAGTVRGIGHACPPGQVPPSGFEDVGDTVHAAAVECAAWWSITSGRTPISFEPRATVTRAQMASFLARLVEAARFPLADAPPDTFTDDETSVHEHRIDQLAAVGIIRGRRAGTYDPEAPVTRAEMATFLARTHDLVAAERLRPGADRFADDNGSAHARSIDAVAAVGVAAGTSATAFQPGVPVRREQMATFLARLLDLLVDAGEVPPR